MHQPIPDMFDDLDIGVTVHDPETGAIHTGNERFEALYGVPAVQFGELTVTDSGDGEGVTQTEFERRARAVADGDPQTVEWLVERADGEDVWVEVRLAETTVDGERTVVVAKHRAISEGKEREQQLTELHEATQDLVRADTTQAVADIASRTATEVLDFPINGIMFADEDTDRLAPATTSEAARELFGQPSSLDSGLGWAAFQAGEARIHNDLHERAGVDGSETPLRSQMSLPLGDHGLLLIGSTEADAFDDTDLALVKILRANVESTLDRMATDQQYRRLTERIESGYYAFDTDWTVTYWNDTIAQRQALPAEDILGKRLWDVYPDIETTTYGETLKEAMATGEQRTVEYYYEPDDYWVRSRIYPDEDGIVVLSADITEQKAYEQRLERTNEQLELLTRVLRHDIGNDLQIITGWTDAAAETATGETVARLETVLETCDHTVELIENSQELIQLVTDDAHIEREPIRLDAVLGEEVDKAREKHTDAAFVCEELPSVTVAATEMLASVFRNLLNNAVVHNDSDSPRVEVDVDPGDDTVRVTVADNGPGVPADRKDQVFGKGEQGLESDGTGIGLYLVNMLVDEFGGRVWVTDNDPRGAVFVVELPRVSASGETKEDAEP